MRSRTILLALGLSAHGTPALAQSLFNAAGLGVPVEALDGRARALGNLGIGLPGAALIPADPASAGRLRISTGVMAGQPSWVDYVSELGPSGRFQGNRFPLMGMAYPLFAGMMSVQIGSFLDQHFQAERVGTIDLGSGPFETTDSFVQDGSVSNLNIGYARTLGERTSVGITIGRYAGSVVRTLTRSYGANEAAEVEDYVEKGTWSYTGQSLTVGVSTDIGSSIRVAGSFQVPTDLDATASAESRGQDRSYDLPVHYRVGASATLVRGLMVTGSVARANWSSISDDLSGSARAGNTNGYGIGVELSRARLWGKNAPLRFGFRRSGLPFSFDDQDATERILSGGFGLVFNTTNDVVLASADFALERGRRIGAGITENFWRATISLLLSGF